MTFKDGYFDSSLNVIGKIKTFLWSFQHAYLQIQNASKMAFSEHDVTQFMFTCRVEKIFIPQSNCTSYLKIFPRHHPSRIWSQTLCVCIGCATTPTFFLTPSAPGRHELQHSMPLHLFFLHDLTCCQAHMKCVIRAFIEKDIQKEDERPAVKSLLP